MNTMKKLGLVACAAMALMAQAAQADGGTDEGFLMSGVGGAYSQFTADLGVFCGAAQPFSEVGEPTWFCLSPGAVDQGIRAGTVLPEKK